MQEFNDSFRRPNLRIKGIEEEEKMQTKGICNIFKKNNRKYPKSRENYAHLGTGSIQDTKQT
jgi:hypothetical protein